MLPASRNRTYGTDTPVAPGDLNDLQDASVGWKHGVIVRPITPRPTKFGSWEAFTGFIQSTAGGLSALIPFDFLTTGDRILQVDARVKGDGVVDCTLGLGIRDDETVIVSGGFPASVTDNNRAAVYGTLNLFTGSRLLATREIPWLTATATAALYTISTILVTYDRP